MSRTWSLILVFDKLADLLKSLRYISLFLFSLDKIFLRGELQAMRVQLELVLWILPHTLQFLKLFLLLWHQMLNKNLSLRLGLSIPKNLVLRIILLERQLPNSSISISIQTNLLLTTLNLELMVILPDFIIIKSLAPVILLSSLIIRSAV